VTPSYAPESPPWAFPPPEPKRARDLSWLAIPGAILFGGGFAVLGYSYVLFLGYFEPENQGSLAPIIASYRADQIGFLLAGVGALLFFIGLSALKSRRSWLTVLGGALTFLGFLGLLAAAGRDADTVDVQITLSEYRSIIYAYVGGFLLVGLGLGMALLGLVLQAMGIEVRRRVAYPSYGPSAYPWAYPPPAGPVEAPAAPAIGQPAGGPVAVTRCERCLSTDLEYLSDGTARCRRCGMVSGRGGPGEPPPGVPQGPPP